MDNDLQSTIKENLELIKARIQAAAKRAGRDPDSIDLVAVTKQKSAVVVKALLDQGLKQIGESYLKEALFKVELLKDFEVDWHMIGNIQSGKEKQVARVFNTVHSVSGISAAEELDIQAAEIGKSLPVYLELNVSGEMTKHGWLAARKEDWKELLPAVERILGMKSLQVMGLMTMAPYSENPEDSRPYFRRVREIRDYLNQNLPGVKLEGMSMGMSGDFEVAIEEGATVLRIGSALVGPRR